MIYLRELETLKDIIKEGRGFRGGSDKKTRRMWLGRENVVAGLPFHVDRMFITFQNILDPENGTFS